MARIVVVGGLGYVGVNIAPALADLGELVVVYRGVVGGFRRVIASRLESLGARLVRIDAPMTADELERLGGDVYIHLAGKISGGYRVQWESHVGLLEAIVEAAGRIGSRVVYTSSVLAYGRLEDLPPGSLVYEEDEHLSGRRWWRSYHARTKAEGERLLVSSSRRLGGRFSIVRPGLVVGSHAYHREWSMLFRLSRLGLYPRLDYTVNYVSSKALREVYRRAVTGGLDGKWVHAVSYHAPYREAAMLVCTRLRGGLCRGLPVKPLFSLAGRLAPPSTALSASWEGVSNGYIFKSRYGVPVDGSLEEAFSELLEWLAGGGPSAS
ncbi:hypothetical protein APE_0763.1 [Aeropyrum pernix K1]|uniref:NAD-dependent epimerase/dehydratase domain-containing protein n=1 Tax=Aeropyrum pernix (strain ATCC 700893 / DSM 11879 / JCM 9820 / NBRC 100138 / K1) TaxID=272557 RepID=Q9YE06_AERPE|nr:NAD-dependent epimerase/dehydratase family protein [Aeropyrum pernix]BAA79741.2 hypothetical protein APE_0763.1 [Aeropyrum pernix K1]